MEEQHTGTTTHPLWRDSEAPYWLIIRESFAHADVFTINRRGVEAVLPVFSSREDARIFAGKYFLEGRWYVKPTGVGELISVLYGPSTKVVRVALDPAREMLRERAFALVSLSREAFVASLEWEPLPARGVVSKPRSPGISMNTPSGWPGGPRGRKRGVTAPARTHQAINRAGKARRR